ncbi:MAG: Vitamin K-dependent gamma-carboxylase [Pseudomonadota bacterium]
MEHLVDGPGVQHGKHLPSALLLCGALGARMDRADPARGAHEGAWGAAAGAYLLAGLAKLLANGAGWLEPQAHALLLLERGLLAPPWLAAPRLFVAARQELAAGLAAAALLIELAGPLLLWRPARAPMVALIGAMHVGIAVLMGYVYLPWVACLLALLRAGRAEPGALPERAERPPPRSPAAPGRPEGGR